MATTYHFYLRKDKARSNGESPVYLRITQNRKSRYLSTGVFINPNHWNPESERIRRSHRNYKALNSIIEREQDKAEQVQDELGNHGKDSAKAIQQRLKQNQTGDFFDLADAYKEELKYEKRHYALKTTKVVLKKLKAFEGGRTLPLRDIDTRYLERFEAFLRSEYGNRSTTINKNFEPIKAVIKKALEQHLLPIDPFVSFDGAARGKPLPKTKLSIEQIKAIEDTDLRPGSNLWHVRNYFMFSFYSGGIRFGDLCCLRWKNIKGDRLIYRMNKNEKTFSAGINKYQQHILDYYWQDRDPEHFIFPILNPHRDYSDPIELRKQIGSKNVVVNRDLKELAKLVNKKIKEDKSDVPKLEGVSFHVARHSFAQHAVESGLSMYELMQTLRHSKIETTQKYLKGLDEQLADKAMQKVF